MSVGVLLLVFATGYALGSFVEIRRNVRWLRSFEASQPSLTCSYCERPLSECDGCVRNATDAEGNVLT